MFIRNRYLATAAALALVIASLLGALTSPALAQGAPKRPQEGPNAVQAVPGGSSADVCRDANLGHTDDGSSAAVTMPFSINFFGSTVQTVYVNNNGNITFDGPLSAYTPSGLAGANHQIVAPFFADVDTSAPTSGVVTYSPVGGTYGGRPAFCADWVDVGYYNSHIDKLNSFQLILVNRSDTGAGNFDIVMNYDRLQWETGDASGGSGGLGGSSAVVGYSNAGTSAYQLPGSLTPGSFLDSNLGSGLVYGSAGALQLGRYIYHVRGGQPPAGGSISGSAYQGQIDPQHKLAHAVLQLSKADGTEIHWTETSDGGDYIVNGLPDGDYYIVGAPPAGVTARLTYLGPLHIASGQPVTGANLVFIPAIPKPADVTVGGIAVAPGGVPVVGMNSPVPLSKSGQCPGGSASYTVVFAGTTIASGSLTESPSGTYSGSTPALGPAHGNALVTITIHCPGGSVVVETFDIYIDPAGHVRKVDGTAIAGATVTLYRSDDPAGPFTQIADGGAVMSPSNRHNPDTTAADGSFHWDVLAGYYVVRAAASGCTAPNNPSQPYVESAVLTIPPPVVDLDLRLQCGTSNSPFSDVGPSDYFYTPVLYLASHAIISGYSDGTFRPYANTTRSQLTKIVVGARGWALVNPATPDFNDIAGNPFYQFIETAYQHGIISGYGDGSFRPFADVTRGQLCKIIVGAWGWAPNTTGGPHFNDVPVSHPFYTAIETAYNRGLVSGYGDGSFRSGSNATRGQISKIVYSALMAPAGLEGHPASKP